MLDSVFGLILLVVLAIPVLAIAGFVTSLSSKRRIETLERRIAVLEGAEARRTSGAPSQTEATPRAPEPMRPETSRAPQATPPPAASVPKPQRSTPAATAAEMPSPPKRSLESASARDGR